MLFNHHHNLVQPLFANALNTAKFVPKLTKIKRRNLCFSSRVMPLIFLYVALSSIFCSMLHLSFARVVLWLIIAQNPIYFNHYKTISASRNLPYAFCEQIGKEIRDISDEVPFEIPEGWEWCRLASLGTTQTGNTPSKANTANFGNFIPFIGPGDIYNGIIDYHNQGLSEQGVKCGRICSANSIIQVCIGGSIGKAAITDREISFNQQLNAITTIICDYKYVFFTMISDHFVSYIKTNAGGTATPIINRGLWERILIPVPPLSEQHRIVAKIEQLLPFIEKYAQAETQLTALNTSFPEALKKSILQEAVQGRLVPQDPNDEPASVLLERIRAEKQALVKAGKIKKDKHESVIVTRDKIPYEIIDGKERCIAEEVPFEIPEGWCWCRLKTICTKLVDGDHNPPKGEMSETEYLMISSTNINNDRIENLDKVRYLSKEVFALENQRTQATKGDIFFTSVGSLGRSCVYNGDYYLAFQRSVSVISTLIFNYYLKYCFDSGYFQFKIQKEATGTAQKGFYLNQLSESLIPLPPLSEQHRIVAKIEELLPIINQISK